MENKPAIYPVVIREAENVIWGRPGKRDGTSVTITIEQELSGHVDQQTFPVDLGPFADSELRDLAVFVLNDDSPPRVLINPEVEFLTPRRVERALAGGTLVNESPVPSKISATLIEADTAIEASVNSSDDGTLATIRDVRRVLGGTVPEIGDTVTPIDGADWDFGAGSSGGHFILQRAADDAWTALLPPFGPGDDDDIDWSRVGG